MTDNDKEALDQTKRHESYFCGLCLEFKRNRGTSGWCWDCEMKMAQINFMFSGSASSLSG